MMEKTIDVYQGFISFFKRGKVGASPTAWTNAIMGNPTMAWMAGINIRYWLSKRIVPVD